MIKKKVNASTIGRRNKQQILKDFVRPSPANVVSSAITGVSGRNVGDLRGCAGGPNPTDVSTWIVRGSADCDEWGTTYPNWTWQESSTTIGKENPIDANTLDGSVTGIFLTWPALVMGTQANGVGDTNEVQNGQILVSTGCHDFSQRIAIGHIAFDGDSTTEPPIYLPFDQFSNPNTPSYYTGGTPIDEPYVASIPHTVYIEPFTDAGTGSEFNFLTTPLAGRPADNSARGRLVYYDSTKNDGTYPLQINAILDEWVWEEFHTPDGFNTPHRTGQSNPQEIVFEWKTNIEEEFTTLRIGDVFLTKETTSSVVRFGWILSRSAGLREVSVNDDERPVRHMGPLDGQMQFLVYHDNDELGEPPPDTSGLVVEANLIRDGDDFYPPVPVQNYITVWFDGQEAFFGSNYTLSSDGQNIQPNEFLDYGTVVNAKFLGA